MTGRPQAADSVLAAWSKHENAPRTTCAECHFESSKGYPQSHAPCCSLAGLVQVGWFCAGGHLNDHGEQVGPSYRADDPCSYGVPMYIFDAPEA